MLLALKRFWKAKVMTRESGAEESSRIEHFYNRATGAPRDACLLRAFRVNEMTLRDFRGEREQHCVARCCFSVRPVVDGLGRPQLLCPKVHINCL